MLTNIKSEIFLSIGAIEVLKHIDWNSENLGLALQLIIATLGVIRVIIASEKPLTEVFKKDNIAKLTTIFKGGKKLYNEGKQNMNDSKNTKDDGATS